MRADGQCEHHAFDIRQLAAKADFAVDGNEMCDQTHDDFPYTALRVGTPANDHGVRGFEAYPSVTSNVRRFRHKVTRKVKLF
jgi:hypothetical protein